jgi:predicted MFS family arabinose efflux permease
VLAGLRMGGLVRPAAVFGVIAMASGVVATFLPLAVPTAAGLVAAGLLVQSIASTLARWFAGRHGDRRGAGRLLLPAVLAAAAGMGTLILVSVPAAVIVAMVLFGIGFGIAQNASAALMYQRVDRSGYGTVSAVWNIAYDGGIGIGAVGFGFVTVHTGYPTAFALTGALILLALLVIRADRRSDRP